MRTKKLIPVKTYDMFPTKDDWKLVEGEILVNPDCISYAQREGNEDFWKRKLWRICVSGKTFLINEQDVKKLW